MIIDRRNLLTSLAATTACTPLGYTANAADPTARRGAIRERGGTCEGWLLAIEPRPQLTNCTVCTVDFWARPFTDIAYTHYLPPEVTRCAMSCEAFEQSNRPTLEAIHRSMKDHCCDWPGWPRFLGTPRFAAHLDGIDTLSSTLQSLVGDKASNSTARTAFVSLDSFSPTPLREPSWAEVLPAFRSCYDRVVGHFHLPQRGLRQWRNFLNAHFEEGYFQEYFVNAAAQCDAVILTSPALVESDLWCCPSASTEELVKKLMRDLGCALLTPAVLNRIVGAGERGTARKPRLFALASWDWYTPDDDYFANLVSGRQADLVWGSFGNNVPDEHTLTVATVLEDPHSDLAVEIRRRAGENFYTTTTPAYEFEKRSGHGSCNHLRLIRLLPFQMDEDKLRSA